jgi:ribonucleotide reductase alpha subunit
MLATFCSLAALSSPLGHPPPTGRHGIAPSRLAVGRLRGGGTSVEQAAEVLSAAAPLALADGASMLARLTERYLRLSVGLDASIGASAAELAQRVMDGLTADASAQEVDQLCAETAAYLTSHHPDYSKLAARVAVERLHAHTSASFAETMQRLATHRHPKRGTPAPLVTPEFAALARRLAPQLDQALDFSLDFEYDYFGLRTLMRSYLLGSSGPGLPLERPQHMLMRVALAIHGDDVHAVLAAYNLTSRGLYTHATPTLFNAGCPRGQLCSCFLLTTADDSVEGIFRTLSDCALISRSAGGIGLSVRQDTARGPRAGVWERVGLGSCGFWPHPHRLPLRLAHPSPRYCRCGQVVSIFSSSLPPPPQVSHIRAAGSYIRSTGGKACGLVPMLRVFDATARYVDQVRGWIYKCLI